MSKTTTLPSRLAIGMCGFVVGAYCAYTAFRNGQAMAADIDGIAFGSAFAAVVVGSWFLLPLAEEFSGIRASVLRGGWALCLAFVLVNAIGFTATHRTEGVSSRTTAIQTYDAAIAALPLAETELAAMKQNARWAATAGCTNATAEASKLFCEAIATKQSELKGIQARVNQGRPGAADAQADTIAWVMQADASTVSRALPIFMAVVLEIAASLFMFAAMVPSAKAEAPAATITEPVVETKAEDALPVIEAKVETPPLMIEAKPTTKAKSKAKKKAKPIAIDAKVDGRAIAGQRWRLANDDAALVPASAE